MDKLERKVPIANIFYMFSYIWNKVEVLEKTSLDNSEDFESTDIVCKLFLENIKDIIKVGLYKEYNLYNEELRGIKGKLDFKNSINNMSFQNAKAFCEYDELEINNPINQVLKTTALRLYRINDINENHKKELNHILLYFNQVDVIDLTSKSFDIKFNRNNYYTYFTIMVCKLIFDFTMISENKGKFKFIDILDDDKKMQEIFELFVYKFYSKKLKDFNVSYQNIFNWKLNNGDAKWLPKMRLDILITNDTETIILDTKYYSNFYSMNNAYFNEETKKFHSNNMYQMFSYMSNINIHSDKIKGILLYPVPYCKETIDEKYDTEIVNNGTTINAVMQIKTIDLSAKWNLIEEELLKIVNKN